MDRSVIINYDETDRMMLVFVTRSCNAGTASAFKVQAECRTEKVQGCVEVVRLTPHDLVQRRNHSILSMCQVLGLWKRSLTW